MLRQAVCVLVVAAAGTASAQHARFPRVQPDPEVGELSERVRPIVPEANTPAPVPTSLDLDPFLSMRSLRTPLRAEQGAILEQRQSGSRP
jgi:hypothetical protein